MDLSFLLTTQHEYRAQFEADFMYAQEFEDVTGEIQTVIADYTVGNLTGTITVPTP